MRVRFVHAMVISGTEIPRRGSLMIITATSWPIRTTDARESTDSGKIPIDYLHAELHPKVGRSVYSQPEWPRFSYRLETKCTLLSQINFSAFIEYTGIFCLWVVMKPGVVLLGLVLLLDSSFAAEGILHKTFIQDPSCHIIWDIWGFFSRLYYRFYLIIKSCTMIKKINVFFF